MKKRIIVACGGAVATSTVAADKIAELCKKENIPVEIIQCRVSEIASKCDNVDLIVTTSRVKKDYGIPLVSGMSFVSGINVEKTEETILSYLK
ncbi:PTS galactitol transporter subunit IIB [Maledivibacter halophilus]|uniref:PTS system galactitol-specific EIIB component, Gat family (TC 4.A.5.1.1) n=1 Tax=Maledivibacter halophilus TaxID=36842 RepID=A0A1T5JTL9_9FIRM|nr:PTS galactitol transporter subunit IIB [Maledivibacter halophilus]SKC54704.1 PTS system galactitol-specific EIIB component, Gat family (TC 4.A.5.1.1) [Maledivibacter halophilus]